MQWIFRMMNSYQCADAGKVRKLAEEVSGV